MYKFYENLVPYELSIKLKELGYTKDTGLQYDEDANLVDPAAPGGYEGICEAPTYAQVVDFLLNKGIFISLVPYFTFATINHFGFSYIIQVIQEDRMTREEWPEFASFNHCMNYAIERAINILNEKD